MDRSVGRQYLEETAPLDSQIEAVAGVHQITLGVQFLGGHGTHTGAQIEPGGKFGILRGAGADLAYVLVDQILERGAIALEAGGVDIGQIIGNDRHARLLRIQSGLCDPECRVHSLFLFSEIC